TVTVFMNNHLVATSVIVLGGNNITKTLSNGLRSSTVAAESIKLNNRHAYFETVVEDETVEASIIGSNQEQMYNHVQISDMIEARLEEIFLLADKEIRRMGFQDLRGGYVLTG